MRELDHNLWEMPSGKTILIGYHEQHLDMIGAYIRPEERELAGCEAFTVDKTRAFKVLHRRLKEMVKQKGE